MHLIIIFLMACILVPVTMFAVAGGALAVRGLGSILGFFAEPFETAADREMPWGMRLMAFVCAATIIYVAMHRLGVWQ